jgi:hypothetical protein
MSEKDLSMRFIRENIYERIQREVHESMSDSKGRITKVELTPEEWREFSKHVSVKGKSMRMAFQPTTNVSALSCCSNVMSLDIHYVDVSVKYNSVGF